MLTRDDKLPRDDAPVSDTNVVREESAVAAKPSAPQQRSADRGRDTPARRQAPRKRPPFPAAEGTGPMTVIPRDQHSISRKDISENALKVLYRLNKSGFEAYLVGGGVRDLLLGKKPKDFDITTNATPEQVRKLFRNCRLVGRRFRWRT